MNREPDKAGGTALLTGSFDPFTIGHADLVERALRLFGRVVIAVGYNERKDNGADVEQRADAIRAIYAGNPDVSVEPYTGLTADFARKCGATAIVRGLRTAADFEYEKPMADVNFEVLGIDTVFLPCRPALSFLSSSMVRELNRFGVDVSKFLPAKSGE